MSRPQFNETGGDSASTLAEAKRLIAIIDETDQNRLDEWEMGFLMDLEVQITNRRPPTARQLFKLREIKDKVI